MLILHEPKCGELWFKQSMMEDFETMAYNHAFGGTIPFPKEKWKPWHEHWIKNHENKRYYRYLKNEQGAFVGEISYHYDSGIYLADVIIHSKHRKKGYGTEALSLLCKAAKENGLSALHDNIVIDNPAIGLFLKQGFFEEYSTEEFIFLKKEL